VNFLAAKVSGRLDGGSVPACVIQGAQSRGEWLDGPNVGHEAQMRTTLRTTEHKSPAVPSGSQRERGFSASP
jgi:hypothetical protein